MKQTPAKPAQVNLKVLNPTKHMTHFNYAEEFKKLDLDELKQDLFKLMTDSKDWWPADYGHYGPFFIRMAWHSAGTYRVSDGRGGANTGNQRFAPLNSWPDNGNLDKARRLLWPIKKKYGNKISWADLMILTGNCAMESMGYKPFGFAGGREDIWEPETDVYWGPETVMLAAERYHSNLPRGAGDESALESPLAAVQMGLIYVNPEGPGGNASPLAAAADIRETFGRMAMNDRETVALIAGGHTFGKAHGAADPSKYVGPCPEDASIEEQGLGWKNRFNSGKGVDTITSGLEGAWTSNPIKWDHGYFKNLFAYEWKLVKSPAGAQQWIPTDPSAHGLVPDAHAPNVKHPPVMFTTDLALRMDPQYGPIAKLFHDEPKEFEDAWGKAWYKLTHRDMGPVSRCLGKDVAPPQLWQDPLPTATAPGPTAEEWQALADKIKQLGLPTGHLTRVAWGSASTHRVTDFRGGANGARIRLAPQVDWEVNDPLSLAQVLGWFRKIQAEFNAGAHKVSIADLIVLGGSVAIQQAIEAAMETASDDALKAGLLKASVDVIKHFLPGRTDATADQTDAESFTVLEPTSDGFRNHVTSPGAVYQLVDRAHMLSLTAAEMAVLVGGMRVLKATTADSSHGVFTSNPGALTNDFFVNLLDMGVTWRPAAGGVVMKPAPVFEGCNANGNVVWTATEVDLIFGSNSELRAISEYYAQDDSRAQFVEDFVKTWTKVMNLDRFDVKK